MIPHFLLKCHKKAFIAWARTEYAPTIFIYLMHLWAQSPICNFNVIYATGYERFGIRSPYPIDPYAIWPKVEIRNRRRS